MRPAPPTLLLALLLALLALACVAAPAHAAPAAAELEVLLLDDETSDLVRLSGGYDLAQVRLGEAHLPEVGAGAAGDGLYFRTTLHRDPDAPLRGPVRVVFGFDTPAGPASRWLETTDGRTFTTDFDALQVEAGPSAVEVGRAFVTYASLGVGPGATLSGFRVTSSTGGEPRDVAPGGVFLPGPLAHEVPLGASRVVAAEHVLAGVGGYVRVDVVEESTGVFAVTFTSLLERGAQRVALAEVPPQQGWRVEPRGETAAALGPGGSHTFRLRIFADAPERALHLDVTSDAGGRVGLVAENVRNVLTLRVEDERIDAAGMPEEAEVSSIGFALAIGAAGIASYVRGRRG